MPKSVAGEAQRVGASLLQLGKDFGYSSSDPDWTWEYGAQQWSSLPFPALFGEVQLENAASVLTVVHCLQARLPMSRTAIEAGLRGVRLSGRFQAISVNGNEWLFDVAHNPAAAIVLAHNLAGRNCDGKTIAVCGMFADKDSTGVIEALRSEIDSWVVAGVSGARALAPAALATKIAQLDAAVAHVANDVDAACEFARSQIQPGDRVVVFGSFHTVGPALEWILAYQSQSEKRLR